MIVAKKPVFSLCIPCFRCEKTIKKCLDSILDQDENGYEVICVVNGDWEGKEKTIKIITQYAKKDSRIRCEVIKEANACIARNAAADVSRGTYLSFFSSDFFMYPGALRKWEETFKEHPEADFIYAGYRLMRDGVMDGSFVPSRPFDPWELTMENYIDGGFPMKREVWEKGKWDADIKSLNDWDFWLTAIGNGFKGYFMPEPTYAAEYPKPGGLSADSHANWLERIEQIKGKHKIPINDICVVSLGAQPHAKRIAKMIGADFRIAPQMKPHKYKAIYLLGFYIGNGDSAIAHSQVFKNAPEDCKRVIHWIGTDILQLMGAAHKVCYADMKQLTDMLNECINITEFEQTQNELLSMDIKSEVLALPIEPEDNLMPLPKKPVVAVYTPNNPTAKQIYNLDFMVDLIKSCPDIDFLLFGGGLMDFKPLNVKNLGWCDIKKAKELSSILMRITYHDGLPVTPIEWRLSGRDVITTVQMPFIHYAGSGVLHEKNYAERKEQIIKLLRQVIKDQKKKGVKDVKEASEYYLKLTNPCTFKNRLLEIISATSIGT